MIDFMSISDVEKQYDPLEPLGDAMLLDPPPWRLVKAKFFYATPDVVFPISAQVPKGQAIGNCDGVTFQISKDYFKKNPFSGGTADYFVRDLLRPYFKEYEGVRRKIN